jgi:hypothetical protein
MRFWTGPSRARSGSFAPPFRSFDYLGTEPETDRSSNIADNRVSLGPMAA